ncbi:MAG: Orn/DAP/Arg decarboxylase 2 [Phycisphaerales bacterium]|nr:Orn/DAP/Arg decarboxylase 2 [Phycisphaerales bacterium]
MGELLAKIAAEFGTPCFVYDLDQIRDRARDLRNAFGGRFEISYAVKCNPNPTLLRRMRGVVDLLDISSGGELARALAQGWPPEVISFTGPAKRDGELKSAALARVGLLVLESIQEAQRLNVLAPEAGVRQAVLIRIAPAKVPAGFGSRMAGRPSQFGIDEEEIDSAIGAIRDLKNLDLCGFHLYAGTQCLDAQAIAQNFVQTAALFQRVCETHDLRPEKLIFGSGLGIPYYDQDIALDLAPIGAATTSVLDEMRRHSRFAQTRFVLETGRYLVGEAGVYLTRIVSAKQSRGAQIRICDGGMNHHLGACGHLGSVIRRNYRMFKVEASQTDPTAARGECEYDLYGPLCTSIDVLAQRARFASLEIGDVVAVRCSGAYGPTASPIHFISHDPPREILVENASGQVVASDISWL